MLPAETLKRIQQIEIRTRRLVRDAFSGAYHSVFKGRGMMFESVRPYQPGDDVRDIEWNITARGQGAYIKQYVEERELTVLIVLDSSSSCLFGTVKQSKHSLAVEIGAVVALAAIANNDKVGLMIFSDEIKEYVAPGKGRNHGLRIIRDLFTAQTPNAGTNISIALQAINRLLKRRSVVFFLSDFLATSAEYERDLIITAQRHDFIAVMLSDPLESEIPKVGLINLRDAETGEERMVDTSTKLWRKAFHRQTEQFDTMRHDLFNRANVDRIAIPVDGDYVVALTQFFQRRAKRSSS